MFYSEQLCFHQNFLICFLTNFNSWSRSPWRTDFNFFFRVQVDIIQHLLLNMFSLLNSVLHSAVSVGLVAFSSFSVHSCCGLWLLFPTQYWFHRFWVHWNMTAAFSKANLHLDWILRHPAKDISWLESFLII